MGANIERALTELVAYVSDMHKRIANERDMALASRLHSELTARLEKEISKLSEQGVDSARIQELLRTQVEVPESNFFMEPESKEEDAGTALYERQISRYTALAALEPATLTGCQSNLMDAEAFSQALETAEKHMFSISYDVIDLVTSGYAPDNRISVGEVLKNAWGVPFPPHGFTCRCGDAVLYSLAEPLQYQTLAQTGMINSRLARLTPERFRQLFDMKRLLKTEMLNKNNASKAIAETEYLLTKTLSDFTAMKRLYRMASLRHFHIVILRLQENI